MNPSSLLPHFFINLGSPLCRSSSIYSAVFLMDSYWPELMRTSLSFSESLTKTPPFLFRASASSFDKVYPWCALVLLSGVSWWVSLMGELIWLVCLVEWREDDADLWYASSTRYVILSISASIDLSLAESSSSGGRFFFTPLCSYYYFSLNLLKSTSTTLPSYYIF